MKCSLGNRRAFCFSERKRNEKENLAILIDSAVQTDATTEPTEQTPYSEEKMLLPEHAELYQQNGDLVGWISIADTNIDYPVIQSVNEPNFYLKHGFDKEYSDYSALCSEKTAGTFDHGSGSSGCEWCGDHA